MKICSTSLVIKEMQIKTTMRHSYKPIRMVKIKKTNHTKYLQEYGVNRTLVHCFWEYKILTILEKSLAIS